MTFEVRPARPDDLPGIRAVCIRTGDAGGDATGTHPDDGILPDVYAEPYLRLEPDLATVVVDGDDEVVGYLVGTPDTDAFLGAWRRSWSPVAATRHPSPSTLPDGAYRGLVTLLHDPRPLRTRWVDRYPAHLHVDLLPAAQGQGLGRLLVERCCDAVAERGATGVHLGAAGANTAAQAFYARLGFEVLAASPDVVWFGRRL